MRALEMAPRVSGGVAHAMPAGVLCRSSERLCSVLESLRTRFTCARGTDADVPDDLVPLDALDGRREIAQDSNRGVPESLVFGEVSADKHEVGTELPRALSRHAACTPKARAS